MDKEENKMGENFPVSHPAAFFENLIHSAVDGVISADKRGKILIFNQAASKICGYTHEEALSSLNIRGLYPGNGAKQVMAVLRGESHGGKGKLESYKVKIVCKNGGQVPIDLNAAIVYDKGVEIATIGFFHDMRASLEMEKELQETQMQLLQAEKLSSIGKLAAGVAHQLNNPLGSIVMFAGLLLEEYDLKEDAKEDINRILRDAQRSHSIVKELLEFSRPSRHEAASHNINQALNRTLFLLENQPIFQNIKVERNFAEALPMAPGNRQQLNHLFMNLLLNAVEAMQGVGKLAIKTRLSNDNQFIHIAIADTGPGIPEEAIDQIFEPFFTTKESGKGTGLGLSLVYSIVRDHGGKITANNVPEGGASFVIELPIYPEVQDD